MAASADFREKLKSFGPAVAGVAEIAFDNAVVFRGDLGSLARVEELRVMLKVLN
jgi:hypothetical protein